MIFSSESMTMVHDCSQNNRISIQMNVSPSFVIFTGLTEFWTWGKSRPNHTNTRKCSASNNNQYGQKPNHLASFQVTHALYVNESSHPVVNDSLALRAFFGGILKFICLKHTGIFVRFNNSLSNFIFQYMVYALV